MVKKVLVLGSTGSIGLNTLAVTGCFPDRFQIVGLTANKNTDILVSQALKFRPKYLCIGGSTPVRPLRKRLGRSFKIFSGKEGLVELVESADFDVLVLAVTGSAATLPLLAALKRGKRVALANKESLVMAGHIIMSQSGKYGAQIIPVDSEQSAIWQCLAAGRKGELKRIYITASGGPLLRVPARRFKNVSRAVILRHPTWRMGNKITVDSATLMNKGFEVIEARWLFGIDAGSIEVLIHPEVLIHSMCEFRDGSILAQVASADMRLPIQYAISYPERLERLIDEVDFLKIKSLTFERPDARRFPCLNYAYQALRQGGIAPAALNAASDESTAAFLEGRLKFIKIPEVIEKVLSGVRNIAIPDLKQIFDADAGARERARGLIGELSRRKNF